jgi:hypothetical protein
MLESRLRFDGVDDIGGERQAVAAIAEKKTAPRLPSIMTVWSSW